MAVVEYMLYKENHRRLTPDFIGDRGHWYNPVDHTYVGWVDDNRDYYVPDTIITLTKEQFVTRALAIHANSPLVSGPVGEVEEVVPLTNEQVTARAEEWYDYFVSTNSG